MQSAPHTRSERHPVRRVAVEVLALGLVAALVVPAAAFAGKGANGKGSGGGGGSASLTVVVLDGPDLVANHGERVTFEAIGGPARAFVGVRCWQGGDFVLDGYTGLFDDYMFDRWVTLNSDYWTAGVDASCTARLFALDRRGREQVAATETFVALP